MALVQASDPQVSLGHTRILYSLNLLVSRPYNLIIWQGVLHAVIFFFT